eukprot:3615627-Ditylum_brightwellii.AAC.1
MTDHPESIHLIPDEEEEAHAAKDDQTELLQWHYCLGHLSFTKLQLLSTVGILPRHLSRIRPPKCARYLYGAMTRRVWRTKTKQNANKIKHVISPGA